MKLKNTQRCTLLGAMEVGIEVGYILSLEMKFLQGYAVVHALVD